MTGSTSRKITSRFFIPAFIFFVAITPVSAANASSPSDPFGLDQAAGGTGVITGGYKQVIINVVQGILGIVGVLFLILVIYGGIMWMTSGGNEQRITTAKKILTTAVIGLVIVISAYAISYFIVTNLVNPQGSTQGCDVTKLPPGQTCP